MTDLRISRTTALWLIKVCTRIVRDGTGFNWMPIGTNITRFAIGSRFTRLIYDQDPSTVSWMEAMFSVIKLLAASLAFQIEPGEIGELLENTPPPQVIENMSAINYNDDFEI